MGTKTYDVAVVGAGPAGSTAARLAALGGARTLLVERKREVGTPVQCGEFLPSTAVMRRMLPGLSDPDELLGGALEFARARTRTLRIFSPAGRRYDIPFDGIVIDRDRYERSLADAAVAAGAELWKGTKATALRGDTLETTRGPVHARVVIGADGPKSRVARDLGLAPDPCMAFGVQYLAQGPEFDLEVVEMHFGPVARGGYAWVIPKGKGLANVGLGVRLATKRAEVRRVLDDFVAMLERRTGRRLERIRFTAGLIPVGGPRRRTVMGSVILAGDAAGHLMACNGGGIPTAMIAGRIAGEVAASHVREGLPLSAYEKMWRRAIGRELAHGVTTRRMFDVVTRSPVATEFAMSAAGTRGMRDLMSCRSWCRAGIYV